MPYREVTEKLAAYRREIAALRDKMRALQNEAEPEEVENYRFATTDGPVRLSELFGEREYLFVIHNMGRGCPACTMWADGFNGVLPHLENRAAFVVSSPDDPETQRGVAAARGWRFRMVSHAQPPSGRTDCDREFNCASNRGRPNASRRADDLCGS